MARASFDHLKSERHPSTRNSPRVRSPLHIVWEMEKPHDCLTTLARRHVGLRSSKVGRPYHKYACVTTMSEKFEMPHEDEANDVCAYSWDYRTVDVPAALVAEIDNDKLVIWNQGPKADSAKAYGSRGELKKFRRDFFHTRTQGDKNAFWVRTSALDVPEPYSAAEYPRKTPLRDGFACYADFDCEWFDETLAFGDRLAAAGIDFDLVPTGSWGVTEMKVEAGPTHKAAGLVDGKRTLKGHEATASPEDVVAAWRALKPWHADFAASAKCILDADGKPKKTMTKVRFGKDEVEVWNYHVSVAPRRPLRLWWYWDKPVAVEGEHKARFIKNVARFLQLFAAPPYDACVFNPAQPIFTNCGPVFPWPADFENLPEGLTYHHGPADAPKGYKIARKEASHA